MVKQSPVAGYGACDPDSPSHDGSAESDPASDVARLRAELQERDDIAALAAHELRNPLHALSLQLTLAHNTAEAAAQADIAQRIAKAQATLTRYSDRVTVLMDLLHGSAGTYPLSVRRFDLSAALSALVESLTSEARFRGVSLRVELPPACEVQSDPTVLEQVVDNLVLNALKHAACRDVVVRLVRCDAEFTIEVEDDGRGIALEDQQRIFGKFAVATSNPRGEGTGLGLWIVRRLLAALGSEITLVSAVGRGSIFTMRFPMIQPTFDHKR